MQGARLFIKNRTGIIADYVHGVTSAYHFASAVFFFSFILNTA